MRCPPCTMTLVTPLAGLLLLPLVACTKGDGVPAYLEIPAVEVVTTTAQGSATSKITDAWVSIDEKLLGVWELPAHIPVLAAGLHTINVAPAIKRNGTYDDRLRYPFYTMWNGAVDLIREGSTVVTPQTSYIAQAEFWIEGFEDAFTQFNVTSDSDTTLNRYIPGENPGMPFLENSPCGGFVLDPAHPHMRIYTDENYEANGNAVFLELDYRSDVTIAVGVLYSAGGISYTNDYIYLAPTGSNGVAPWNKIYIDLSPVFNTAIAERDLYLVAELPTGASAAQVYIDNFKLVRIAS
ncbi:MAG: hypothetical protein IPL52_02035 [Flavobacteriales bacterium]|nr:hypothetical protein [Flavobacteriales bacterium]